MSDDPNHHGAACEPESGLTPFSQMLSGLRPLDDSDSAPFTITLPQDWLQGRTAYGGLSASISLAATLRSFPDLPPLRSAQFAFIGPASGELLIRPEILRRGKSTVFAAADLHGEAGLAVRSLLCCGTDRPSSPEFSRYRVPTTGPAEDHPPFFSWPDRPNFMSHFEGHLAGGQFPLSGHTPPEMLVWVRHRDRTTPDDLVSLIAVADALPPTSFAAFTEAVPISTMTWSIDILDPAPHSASGWWLIHNLAETIREGYSAQTTLIWNDAGHLMMSARQNVAIFGTRT
jgi:acyl-CoA thioesterase